MYNFDVDGSNSKMLTFIDLKNQKFTLIKCDNKK